MTFDDSLIWLSKTPRSEQELIVFNLLLRLRDCRPDKSVIGYHGTSSLRAKKILEEGFTGHLCAEKEWRVWFVDDLFKKNSLEFGRRKAELERDTEYAIIKARLYSPFPDTRGRYQWLAYPDKIEILDVEYFKLMERKEEIK